MLDILTFDHGCNTRKVAQNIPEEIGLTYHSFGVRNQYILEMCKGHQNQMTKLQKKHVSTRFSHNNNNTCGASLMRKYYRENKKTKKQAQISYALVHS